MDRRDERSFPFEQQRVNGLFVTYFLLKEQLNWNQDKALVRKPSQRKLSATLSERNMFIWPCEWLFYKGQKMTIDVSGRSPGAIVVFRVRLVGLSLTYLTEMANIKARWQVVKLCVCTRRSLIGCSTTSCL